MTTIVLIPGAFHGSWCFDRLVPLLRDAGIQVVAPDLPGTGRSADLFPPPDQSAWTRSVENIVSGLAGPVVLLGHSRGGIVASLVAEICPDRIALSIYLSAALLPNGTIPLQGMIEASQGSEAPRLDSLPEWLPVPPFDATRSALFNRCTEEEALSAYRQLTPEPISPMKKAMVLSESRFGSVPRAFIECLDDQAIPLAQQRMMQELLPCAIRETIDTDHSPFLSAPNALVGALVRVLERADL